MKILPFIISMTLTFSLCLSSAMISDFGEMDKASNEVYLTQLLIDPFSYNGKKIRTTGFISLGDEQTGYIAPTIEDLNFNLIGRITIDVSKVPSIHNNSDEISGSYVLIEGSFESVTKEEWEGIPTIPPRILRVTLVKIIKRNVFPPCCK